jgi:hypothetical protein
VRGDERRLVRAQLVRRIERSQAVGLDLVSGQVAAQRRVQRDIEQALRRLLARPAQRHRPFKRDRAHRLQPRCTRRLPFGPGEVEPHLLDLRTALRGEHLARAEQRDVLHELARDIVEAVGAGEQPVVRKVERRVGQQPRGERLRGSDPGLGAHGLEIAVFEHSDQPDCIGVERCGQIDRRGREKRSVELGCICAEHGRRQHTRPRPVLQRHGMISCAAGEQ